MIPFESSFKPWKTLNGNHIVLGIFYFSSSGILLWQTIHLIIKLSSTYLENNNNNLNRLKYTADNMMENLMRYASFRVDNQLYL